VSRAARVAGVLALLVSSPARSEPLRFGPHDVTSLFSISKSENRNEVVYAIHLDAQCMPVGDAPVFAFWHMNEKGPAVIESLLGREERAYGIGHQQVVARGSDESRIEVTLRALASRPIVVKTRPGAGHCDAWSALPIAGESAYLYNVYVKLKGLGVDYLLLSGWAMDRTRVLHEKVSP
jgi:Domain of unknown function (DUF4833)